ncbi:TON1 Recruiting Motif 10 [Hibiscus trionum]|uniref:TON1 Recruiting Motif 10 n=1 Tax=Hibiscus trionum TaxID=183268 RepID=A0A9W7IUR4_HIBTR|nr:TON1 Recruiting Motif 10 [Hibiscus trionum]
MALINIPTDHIKLRKTLSIERKPLLLKDYLRDDLSSCSSSGFKSFPRRQCCTTVRFLLEADLKKHSKDNHSSAAKRLLKRSRSKPAGSSSATISALQRASEAVLNAVKLLPFPSLIKSSPSPSSFQSNSRRKGHSPRRFSRKLFKRSFWRKADQEDHHGRGEIKRWKLFREFLQEKNQPSDQNAGNTNSYTTTDTSSTVITTTTSRVSTSRSSKSWGESEFTANVLQSWSSNSERSGHDDAVLRKTKLAEKRNVSHMVGATGGEDSIKCSKDTANEEGKQQLSPVSVLDCPFDEEEEDDGSVFEHQLARVEGTKQKLMQKIIRFERLARLEPLELETRIATAELEDEHKPESNHQLQELLKLSKPRILSNRNSSNLLSALFVRERLLVVEAGMEEFGINILKNQNPQEWIKACFKEMEENVNWIKFNVEKEEVGSALELELFSSLMDDFLIELVSL